MNNIKRIYTECSDVEEFVRKYIHYLSSLMNRLDTKAIGAFVDELERTRKNHHTIYIIGNGGSAATAMHMVNDIGIDVFKKSGTDLPYRVMSLCENISVSTAIANDSGYQNLFVNQLQMHYRPGDMLIAISASGNSPNVVMAAEWVKEHGGRVIGLLGFDGGSLKKICDISILVETPKGEYGPVEDIHLVIDHMISHWLQYYLQKRSDNEKGE
ncbi:MAG: SIS domain-containing protein [Deltaproteobacteria bacterium]|nr:SIS domain-containing protein [Deltaproteobacteria bacterium]